MQVADILAALRGTARPPSWPEAARQLSISGVTADSRRVGPGMLFAAIPGSRTDGRAHIAEAVWRGAAAVLAPIGTVWPASVPPRPLLHDPEPRQRLAQIAAVLAGPQPSVMVAVTGTNGKTSTVEFLRQIWAGAGHRAASLGTLGVKAPGFDPGVGLTTPDPERLAEMLARLARAGIRHAAMEASSHGLDQHRLDGVSLSAAGFTNFTRDHLDYHGTETAYRTAKLRLFSGLLPAGTPIAASADIDGATLAALRSIAKRRRLDLRIVGEAAEASIRLLAARPLPDGQEIEVEASGARRSLRLNLPGRFQADNALLAAALAEALGERNALDRLTALSGVRGRMELAARLANGAAAYVDYAHTPDALQRLLLALRPHAAGRLHVVFGAGGDRDRGKRPLMGRVAALLADSVIVTDDNPRGEDAAKIRAAILAGCRSVSVDATEIGERARAIETALNQLGPGDVLAVAGKGHEQGQIIGRTVVPFDDANVIRALVGAP